MIKKIKALKKNKSVMNYLKNSSWMLAEYGLKIFSGIFVGIYVARYLGPEEFGLLSYALAIVSIFTIISRLGMESILVRDLSKYPEKRQAYMGTAFILMLLTSIACILILSVLVFFIEADKRTQGYIFVISLGMLFQAAAVIDFNFQSQIQAKYSSIAKSVAVTLIAVTKIILVWLNSELFLFASVYALELFVISLALFFTHKLKNEPNFIGFFNLRLIRPLLKSAWPMILSGIASILYTRIDQIMIKNMLGAHELGIYSAATKIFDGWVIIPAVISISLLPAIVRIKSGSEKIYIDNLSKLFTILFWSGVFTASITSLAAKWVVYYTFGDAFIEAQFVLAIIMWTAPFTALGSVTTRYLTVEGMEKKIAMRTFLGLIINIVINYILIPIYGIEGAAVATLVTIVFTNYLMNYLDRELKQLRLVCNNAILFRVLLKDKKYDQ